VQARLKRKRRIRKKTVGDSSRPRLCVFRSTRHIYAQIIDDSSGKTITSASSLEKDLQGDPDRKGKISIADQVGKLIGRRALEKGVEKIVFDRNGFLYHGRIRAVSEGAREAGLKF
jgi:large subunit ribosomal protein L18